MLETVLDEDTGGGMIHRMSGGIYAVMLRYAIWNNAVGVVCMLLFGKMRYLYNKREPRSIFPRAIAAIGGHAEIVEMLLQESTERVKSGLLFPITQHREITAALFDALRSTDPDATVALLLRAGADANAPNSWDIHNPLDAGGYYERHIMEEFDNTSTQCS
ncbi:uncharacterized protein BO66DRAFT_433836 [Aspergillus aculeatinus CBS 121060]|uniref:Uncharacterized protein n=1 Tax=Aspergillus aculeatinus CBS 121060 TaxID=1448322 RepID=A0ACD1HLM5_9EURO|nr:hypothetical protein BO66DRAFT_433836 [Aspergillus aculeatinus CBS 121060]RAH74723.1 hypothetical protein BO66DRAFT_433836 [Aspergillus aculeatinus CBS 121060]